MYRLITAIKIIYRIGRSSIKLLLGKKPVVQLGSQTVDKEDIHIANAYLRGKYDWNDVTTVELFESKFSEWNGSLSVLSFMGGRVALSACIYALNLKKGDKVMVPAYTCIVVPNAFWYEGIEVIFYDIELGTYGPSFDDLKVKFKSDVKAVLIHHLFGVVCKDFEKILDWAKERDVMVIEDCAHAMGTEFRGKKVGNFGDVAFYSSEQSKVISTFNGGLAVTNNEVYAGRLRDYQKKAPYPSVHRVRQLLESFKFCYYSQKWKFREIFSDLLSVKYRNRVLQSTTEEEMKSSRPSFYGQKMPAPLAAIGINQLEKIELYNSMRTKNAVLLQNEFNNYQFPEVIENSKPVYLRLPYFSKDIDKDTVSVCEAKGKKLTLGKWFLSYLHPVKYDIEECPNAMEAVKHSLNLPTIL